MTSVLTLLLRGLGGFSRCRCLGQISSLDIANIRSQVNHGPRNIVASDSVKCLSPAFVAEFLSQSFIQTEVDKQLPHCARIVRCRKRMVIFSFHAADFVANVTV